MAEVDHWKRCLRYLGSTKYPNWRACDIDSEIDEIDQIDVLQDKEKHKFALFGCDYHDLLNKFEGLMREGEQGKLKHEPQSCISKENRGPNQDTDGKEEVKDQGAIEVYVKDLPFKCKKQLQDYLQESERVFKGWDHMIEKFEIPLDAHCHLHCMCCSHGSECLNFLYALSQREPESTLQSYIQTMRNIELETLREGAVLLQKDLKAVGVKEETALADAVKQHPLLSLRSCHIVKRNWLFVALKLAEHWNDLQDLFKCPLVNDELLPSFSEMVILHLEGRNITLGKLVEYCKGWNMEIVHYITSRW